MLFNFTKSPFSTNVDDATVSGLVIASRSLPNPAIIAFSFLPAIQRSANSGNGDKELVSLALGNCKYQIHENRLRKYLSQSFYR